MALKRKKITECAKEIGLTMSMIRRRCRDYNIGEKVKSPLGDYYMLSRADVKKIVGMKRVNS